MHLLQNGGLAQYSKLLELNFPPCDYLSLAGYCAFDLRTAMDTSQTHTQCLSGEMRLYSTSALIMTWTLCWKLSLAQILTGLHFFGCDPVHARQQRQLKKPYRQRHNTEPSEHGQYVDGATRMIKSYTEADRDLVEDAIMRV
jgi:hypothetical protein